MSLVAASFSISQEQVTRTLLISACCSHSRSAELSKHDYANSWADHVESGPQVNASSSCGCILAAGMGRRGVVLSAVALLSLFSANEAHSGDLLRAMYCNNLSLVGPFRGRVGGGVAWWGGSHACPVPLIEELSPRTFPTDVKIGLDRCVLACVVQTPGTEIMGQPAADSTRSVLVSSGREGLEAPTP